MALDHSLYIVHDPYICSGEPVIQSTRVTVRTVLASLAEGATVAEILEDFPSSTKRPSGQSSRLRRPRLLRSRPQLRSASAAPQRVCFYHANHH
jgi:hypothetical protein